MLYVYFFGCPDFRILLVKLNGRKEEREKRKRSALGQNRVYFCALVFLLSTCSI